MSRLIKRQAVVVEETTAAPARPQIGRVIPMRLVSLGETVPITSERPSVSATAVDGEAAADRETAAPTTAPTEAPPAASPAPADQLSLAEFEAKAQRIIAGAQSRAEFIIDEALAGAERLQEEARKAGFEAGRAAGLEAAKAEIEALREELAAEQAKLAEERLHVAAERERLQAEAEMAAARLRTEAEDTAEQLIAASQNDIVNLAMAVAERIVRRHIERDPEALIGILAGALQRVRGAGAVTVRVSPEGVAVLNEADGKLDRTSLGIEQLTITADPALELGDVVVETNQGTVDARLDRQVQQLQRSLQEVVTGD